MATAQPYRSGILSDPLEIDEPASRRPNYRPVPAERGLTVTHRGSGMVGAVVSCTPAEVVLRDDSGRDHRLRNTPGGWLVDRAYVSLVPPRTTGRQPATLTASGSVREHDLAPRIARASRIMVEGIHDAELIEKVWGDDLRAEGIVVQPMDGADDLVEVVRRFGPRPGRRLGILLDHLVEGTKETRLAAMVDHPDVQVSGHEFVDVWAAIDPRLAGLDRWPEVPRSVSWKDGICAAVGAADPRSFWRELLGRVSSYADLDPSLVGAIESLIDFVTSG